jgi:hypothetical protein
MELQALSLAARWSVKAVSWSGVSKEDLSKSLSKLVTFATLGFVNRNLGENPKTNIEINRVNYSIVSLAVPSNNMQCSVIILLPKAFC